MRLFKIVFLQRLKIVFIEGNLSKCILESWLEDFETHLKYFVFEGRTDFDDY